MTGPRVIGERVAVLEKTYEIMEKRLEKLELASERQDAKLDMLLRGQEQAAVDRAKQTDQITAMTPDVEMVKNARKWVKRSMWIGGVFGSVFGALVAAKGWIILNWNWFLGR